MNIDLARELEKFRIAAIDGLVMVFDDKNEYFQAKAKICAAWEEVNKNLPKNITKPIAALSFDADNSSLEVEKQFIKSSKKVFDSFIRI